MARGDLDAAEHHLAAAYAAAPDRRPVRQLLGEIYALQGEPERAVQLWQGLDLRSGQLQAREFWYGHVEQPERLQRLRAAIAAWQSQQ